MKPARAHHRPKLHALQIFTGSIEMDELHARGARLHIHRGAERRTVDKEGNPVGETYESHAVLPANVGDRVIVMGPGLHEVDSASVVTVYPAGDRYYVKLREGAIDKTTKRVKVLRGAKAAKK